MRWSGCIFGALQFAGLALILFSRGGAAIEEMLARRNHVGLLSEDLDPKTGELWGNYPQTYSLVGIINAATRLSRPWSDLV